MVTILLMLAVLIIVGHVLVCFGFRSSSCVYLSANCSDMFRYVGGAVIGLFFLVHVFSWYILEGLSLGVSGPHRSCSPKYIETIQVVFGPRPCQKYMKAYNRV